MPHIAQIDTRTTKTKKMVEWKEVFRFVRSIDVKAPVTTSSQPQVSVPQEIPLLAGHEFTSNIGVRLETIRSERLRMAAAVTAAEDKLAEEETRARESTADWKAACEELVKIPELSATIEELTSRVKALLDAVEVIETELAFEAEDIARKANSEVISKARHDATMHAEKRETELGKLEESLAGAVSRVKENTEGTVKQREEDLRIKVETAFDRALKKDLDDFRRFGPHTAASAKTGTTVPAEKPIHDEQEDPELEKFLSSVPQATNVTTITTTVVVAAEKVPEEHTEAEEMKPKVIGDAEILP